jgi:hypothetical protein
MQEITYTTGGETEPEHTSVRGGNNQGQGNQGGGNNQGGK